ncbi:MAG: hypothetical protein GEV06_11380 [Luteitalea sp.]|nr:hypothetical protein [Luteitalea sp.]
MVRQYGPGAGSIRSVELVTADGRLLQVNEDSHPDLLWGLRGGGGNFGIVTALECTLYPVKEIFGGQVAYPMAQGREVLNAYVQWAKTVPDAMMKALKPSLTGEMQINALGPGSTGPAQTRAAYSQATYLKLVALKDTYDPDNIFRFNHNIPPSSHGEPSRPE